MNNQINFCRHRLALLSVFVFTLSTVNAQEPIGLITDNYLPSSGALFNPASVFTSPNELDINVMNVNALAYNNLAYVDQLSLLSMTGNNMNNKEVAYDYPNTIRAYSRASLQGPSFIFQQNSISFGILTQVRSATSLITGQIPSNLDFNNILFDSLYQFPASKAAGINWMSVGAHLGKSVGKPGHVQLSMAFNLNYLAGWDGISAATDQTLNFIKNQENQTMSFSNVSMNYGYTSGFGNDVQQNLTAFQFKGSGVGTDAGFILTGGRNPSRYKWKAGMSVMDVGFISFSKNAQRYELTTDTAVTITKQEFSSLTSADAFTQLAAEAVQGKGSLNSVQGPLKVWLPAAFSFQGEVAMHDHFFINAMLVQRMVLSSQQVLRANSITITPRYETKRVAIGLPLGWNDYHRVMLGGFLRYGPMVVGTDNLEAMFIPSKFEGADVYAGVHIPLSKKVTTTHVKSSSVNCPKF